DGIVLLGTNLVYVGSNTNPLSTEFGGVIQGDGSIDKFGSATLTLTRANTYTGGTTVTGGFLRVNNRTGSATGSGPVVVESGATLGGAGVVTGLVTVSGTLAPGTGATTLKVKKTLIMDGTYLCKVRTTSA